MALTRIFDYVMPKFGYVVRAIMNVSLNVSGFDVIHR